MADTTASPASTMDKIKQLSDLITQVTQGSPQQKKATTRDVLGGGARETLAGAMTGTAAAIDEGARSLDSFGLGGAASVLRNVADTQNLRAGAVSVKQHESDAFKQAQQEDGLNASKIAGTVGGFVGQAVPYVAGGALGRVGGTAAELLANRGISRESEQDRINQMTPDDLAKVPLYQQKLAELGDPAKARAAVADAAGQGGAHGATLATLITGGLHASGLTDAITGQFRSRAARALAGGALGAATGEGFGAAQTAGANAETGEDRSALAGGLDMAGIGGVAGLITGAFSKGHARGAPAHDQAGTGELNESPSAATEAAGAPSAAGPLPDAGPQEAAAAKMATPPPEPQQQAPTVTDAQPAFTGGTPHPVTGEVEVAPNVHVDPNAGALSKTLAQAALRGDLDRPATATLSDGTQFNTQTGEVIGQTQPQEQAETAPAAEQPKAKPPTPAELDQIVFERLQQDPMMDSLKTAAVAKSLGVTLGDISAAKKRVRKFMAEGATDETQVDQQQPGQPVSADAGLDAAGNGRNESPNGAEAAPAAGQTAVPADARRAALVDRPLDPEEAQSTRFQSALSNATHEHGLTPDAAASLKSLYQPLAKDRVTGFYRNDELDAAAERAQTWADQNKQPATYVEADLTNVNGQNKANGATATDAHIKAAATMIQQHLEATGAHVVPVRKGGDELGFVVSGADKDAANAAMTKARQAVAAYAKAHGIDQVPHTKEGKSGGYGIHFGAAEIRPGVNLKESFQEADRLVERRKEGESYEQQATPETARAVASGERQQEAAGGTAKAERGKPAGNTGAAAGGSTEQRGAAAAGGEQRVAQGERQPERAAEPAAAQHAERPGAVAAPDGWETNAIKAHAYAKKLGLEPTSRKLADLVPAIRDHVAGKDELAAAEQSGRSAIEAQPQANHDALALEAKTGAAAQGESGSTSLRDTAGAAPGEPKVTPSKNKYFTDEDKAKALAVLRKKRGQMNAGIDPELFTAAATVAGWHIENGTRKFGAFARAMVDEIGDWIKPHLAGLYEYIRRHPDMADVRKEMTSTEDVDKSHDAGIPELQQKDTPNEEARTANEEGAATAGSEEGRASGEAASSSSGRDSGDAADDNGEARAGSGRQPAAADESGRGERGDTAAGDAEGQGRAAPEEAATAPVSEGQGEQGSTNDDGAVKPGGDNGAAVRHSVADDGGAAALASPPAEAVRPPEKQRAAGKQPAAGRAADTNPDETVRASGVHADGSVAGSPRRVSDSESRRVQHSVEQSIADRDVAVEQPQGAKPSNFIITPDFPLGEGGAKSKAAGNIEAIRMLKQIENEGRTATPAEQAVLARYVGWGGIPQAFEHPTKGATKGWEKVVAAVKEHMTPEELEAARRSTQDAHYTSREVVGGVYDGLERLGFTGGLTLEPSIGTGNFLGLAPASLRGGMRWKGVELDSLTGRIAQHLYPDSHIIAGKGFQDVVLPENYFDAVVGNPPFGSKTLFDPNNKDLKGFSIHNFFFAKALKSLKPGGVMSMVVSHSMLDKLGGKQREWLADRARFLGAIRLPDSAFKENAGTEVTTDLVFLQKLHDGEKAGDRSWTETTTVPDPAGGEPIPLNRYFADHPEMMLGTMTRQGQMRRADMPTLTAHEGLDMKAALAKAVSNLPENVVQRPALIEPGTAQPFVDVSPDVQPYGHYVDDQGRLMQRLPDEFDQRRAQEVTLGGRDVDRMKAMIDLRDRLKTLMRGEQKNAPDAMLNAQRAALNRAYDAFQKKYGYLNNAYNASMFRDDPDTFRLRALEKNYQRIDHAEALARGLELPKGKKSLETAEKADILKQRVFTPEKKVKAETAADSLGVSLNTFGRVNLDAMAEMLGKPRDQIVRELGERLYNDPKSGWTTAEDYLSGNVKAKLAEARAAAADDPALERNVRALEAVQPPDVAPADIYVSLGSPWVHPEVYQDFAREVLNMGDTAVRKVESLQKFNVQGGGRGHDRFAAARMSARDIFLKAINNDPIQIFTTAYENGKEVRRLDSEATSVANAAVDAMRSEFGDWVWKDRARRDRLARIYNDTYNTDRDAVHDGSHLTFPGKVDDSIVALRPSQLNAAWRAIKDGKILMDHVVGAGKTFTAIVATMKKKQMGLVRKPMVAVPNHLVQQWAADWMRLYPDANILAVGEADFAKDRRKLLFSRIATGDWDAVIVAHSQFSRIAPPDDFMRQYKQEKLKEILDARKAEEASTNDRATMAALDAMEGQVLGVKKKKGMSTKEYEALKDQAREKINSKLEGIARDEDTAHFDEMGIDDLTVDEAHEFKNLGFATRKRNVSGMGSAANGGSKKAEDLFIKTRYLDAQNGGRGLSLLTGTPVSNSLAEMYTMQRYLSYDDMKARGIAGFDLWANTFAQESTEYELDSSGRGLKPKTVLKKFLNVPEMMQLYKRFADTVTMDDLKRTYKEKTGKEWPVPNVKGGKPQNIVVQPSAGLLKYIEGNIIPRMQAISGERGQKPDPRLDNMLKVTNDARLAALDVRLKDPSAPDDPNSKPNQMIQRALNLYRQFHDKKGTQLIFCDLSTPKGAVAKERADFEDLQRRADEGDEGAQAKLDAMSPDEVMALSSQFSVYDDVKAKLIAAGVPAREIAFIHDANTDLQKKTLFDKVNRGEVRFLMGSTSKMGAGTNVQRLLVGLHHLDAPWRPADLEQREGRIIRQGNDLAFDEHGERRPGFEVEVNRYAAERTYDARMWQLIERKAAVVEQIRKADTGLREVDDVAGEAANAAEMKAAATGNPLLIEQVETQAKVKRLTALRRSYDSKRYDAEGEIARLQGDGGPDGRYQRSVERAEAGEKTLESNPYQPFGIKVGDQSYDEHKAGAQALAVNVVDAINAGDRLGRKPTEVATFRGAHVVLQRDMGIDQLHVRYDDPKIGEVGDVVATNNEGNVSGAGLITKLNNVIDRMSGWRNAAEYQRERDTKRIGELNDVLAQPFKQDAEFAEAKQRLTQINSELAASVNQQPRRAPAQVAPDESHLLGPLSKKQPEQIVPPTPRAAKTPGLTTQHAQLIDSIARQVNARAKGIRVQVLNDHTEIPGYAEALARGNMKAVDQYSRARGLVRRNPDGSASVYLMADKLPDLAQARRTIAHEVVGHYGMERLLGDNFARVASDALALVRSGGPQYSEIRTRLYRYKGASEATLAKEALAMMAEGRFKNGVMARVYAAVRSFLRDIGLHDGAFSHEEIVAMTHDAAGAVSRNAERSVKEVTDRKSPFQQDFDLADGETLADAPPERVHQAIHAAAQMHVRGIPDAIVSKIQDWKPELLGGLTLRQLADVSSKYLPQVKTYTDTLTRMLTRRNQLEAEHAPTAQKWAKFQADARRRATAEQRAARDTDSDRLTAIMHDATLAGADPDKAFIPGTVKLASGETVAAEGAHALADELEARAKRLTGVPAEILLRDADRLRAAADAEPQRAASYDGLKKRFDAMPQTAKEIYREARDLYAKRSDDMLNAILGRIDSLDVPKAQKVSLTNQMRAHFESARVQAPYFPLARFGEYWISAEKNGEREFRMMESRAQQKRILDAYKAEGYAVRAGTKIDTVRAQDGASGNFMSQVTKVLADQGVPAEAADEIYQMYLRTMPDLSVRKNFIHRKGTPGYDSDALRAFAAHAQHGSYQLARMEHAPTLEQHLRAAKTQVAEHSTLGDDTAAVSAGRMYDEMLKRHQWAMNPTHSKAVQKLTSANFLYYLAATPAQALVNGSQNFVTTLPVLAAKHGYGAAMTELTKGMGQAIKTLGNTHKVLTGDEARAYQELTDMGAIDRTLVHDIAGLGDNDTRDYTGMTHRAMSIASALFHKSEVMNRESTGMAAYRLERAAGASHDAAVKAAADAIWESHFDYSNANRARWMQGSLGKIVFAMKQYSQNMTYYLWRNLYQSFKGETPEVKRLAQRKLVGTLGMTAAFSGLVGLPLMSTVFAAANGANALFGDPDTPFDAETEFRNFLVDNLGKDFGQIATTGVANELTGLDFASRTKLDQMWYRDADREQTGRSAADYLLEQIAGPIGNMMVLNPFQAAKDWSQGNGERAVEDVLPKALKDLLKTARYTTEGGVNDRRGNPVVQDLSPFQLLGQAAGFSPAEVAEQYQINNALYNYQQAITDRRKALIDAYAMAMRMNDTEAVRAANEKIDAFNGKNPEVQINGATLRRMLMSKERYNERAVNGLVLNKKLEARTRAAIDFDNEDNEE